MAYFGECVLYSYTVSKTKSQSIENTRFSNMQNMETGSYPLPINNTFLFDKNCYKT